MARRWNMLASCLASVIVIGIPSVPALADISETIFEITATNDLGSATFRATIFEGHFNPETMSFDWVLSHPVPLMSPQGTLIAELSAAHVRCENDPVISLGFSVLNGSLATTFTLTSPTLSFPVMNQGEGRAPAGITISDVDGDGVAYHTGTLGGYLAQYNGLVPTGTTFANLQTTPLGTDVPGGTATRGEEFPGGGTFSPIAAPFSNLSDRFRFSLTPNDIASGTSELEVRAVPGPGVLALVGPGGLVAVRRSRRQ